MKKIKSKYRIYDGGMLVPAFTRKPRDTRAVKLTATTAEERRLGIKYYIPKSALEQSDK